MKKVWIFIILIMMLEGYIQNGYAYQSVVADEVQKVSIGYSTPDSEKKDLYSDNYTTINKNEIRMITHYLGALKMTKGSGTPSDTRFVSIMLEYSDDTFDDYRIYPSTLKLFMNTEQMKIYEIPITEYYRMCDFINSLILNKFDKNSTISAEPSSWAKEYIDEAIMEGLIIKWNQIGYTNNISRVEVCQLIDNLLTVKGIEKKTPNDYTYLKEYPFDDTRDISVKELYLQGIINGKSENEFCPYDNITREEFSRILSEAYKIVSKSDSYDLSELQYKDKEQISDWAVESIENVTFLGLMQGDENGNFNPKDNITKEQVIVTVLKLDKLME